MSTMFIGFSGCSANGYSLGDYLISIKIAWLLLENEPHDKVILTLEENCPLNFLWARFMAAYQPQIIMTNFGGDRTKKYDYFTEVKNSKICNCIPIDTHKEIYVRMDGGSRQHVLCGFEKGFKGKNIFEYIYFGQMYSLDEPKNTTVFEPNIIYYNSDKPKTNKILIAPEEVCYRNHVFTLEFWKKLILEMLNYGATIDINSMNPLFTEIQHPQVKCSFPSYYELIENLNSYKLVMCGNTGFGWLAAATNAPIISLEYCTHLTEYSYTKTKVSSILDITHNPDINGVIDILKKHNML